MKVKSPNIYRFFTEIKKIDRVEAAKISLFSLVTTLLLVAIMLKGYQLSSNLQALQIASSQRTAVEEERSYWEGVSSRHAGYRDATFKVAILSYELGDRTTAQKYLNMTLQIDPNFTQGRDFAKRVGL
ncbi:MAG TPA: hypothetical protein VG935_01485 [Patescibacteria group bacterium]|nr:hypothetical protein [Patescibacteria group bacterium]